MVFYILASSRETVKKNVVLVSFCFQTYSHEARFCKFFSIILIFFSHFESGPGELYVVTAKQFPNKNAHSSPGANFVYFLRMNFGPDLLDFLQ